MTKLPGLVVVLAYVHVLTLTPQLHLNKNNNDRRLKKSIKDTFMEDLHSGMVKVLNGQDSSS